MRVVLVLAVLLVTLVAVLGQLWARGVPVRVAVKMAIFGAGFVVSIKMVLGGYLALQGGEAGVGVVDTVGFYASIGLALFFGWVSLSIWRREAARSDARARGHRRDPRQGTPLSRPGSG